MKELLGQALGWVIVCVSAWLIGYMLLAYALGVAWPLAWPLWARFTHLAIQIALFVGWYWHAQRR